MLAKELQQDKNVWKSNSSSGYEYLLKNFRADAAARATNAVAQCTNIISHDDNLQHQHEGKKVLILETMRR